MSCSIPAFSTFAFNFVNIFIGGWGLAARLIPDQKSWELESLCPQMLGPIKWLECHAVWFLVRKDIFGSKFVASSKMQFELEGSSRKTRIIQRQAKGSQGCKG